jgi:hypothetical protein
MLPEKNGLQRTSSVDQSKVVGSDAAGALNSRRFSIFLKNLPQSKFNISAVCDFFK